MFWSTIILSVINIAYDQMCIHQNVNNTGKLKTANLSSDLFEDLVWLLLRLFDTLLYEMC